MRLTRVGLDTHGLAWDELDDGGISRLDEFGSGFHDLTGSSVDLLDELGAEQSGTEDVKKGTGVGRKKRLDSQFTSNVGGVAIQHWCVTGTDLSRVVQNDDSERGRGKEGKEKTKKGELSANEKRGYTKTALPTRLTEH